MRQTQTIDHVIQSAHNYLLCQKYRFIGEKANQQSRNIKSEMGHVAHNERAEWNTYIEINFRPP